MRQKLPELLRQQRQVQQAELDPAAAVVTGPVEADDGPGVALSTASTRIPGSRCASTRASTSSARLPLSGSSSRARRSSGDSTTGREIPDHAEAGATTVAETVGETTGPPAAQLYAVDPIGVATITASQR